MVQDMEIKEEKYDELRHICVPHMNVMERNVPNVSDLISMPRRYYIKPIDEVEHQKARFAAHDAKVDSSASDISETTNSTDPVLDLGTAALQRIVTNMKGISFEDDSKNMKYNPEAARLAGLKSYTDFTAAPHKMNEWKAPHSLHKNIPKASRVSSMYVGTGDVGGTRRGRTLWLLFILI